MNSMILYRVSDTSTYKDFINTKGEYTREDVGHFIVQELNFSNWKDLIKYFSDWNKDTIDSDIFDTKKDATVEALKRTKQKLKSVVDTLGKDIDDCCSNK